MADQNPCAMFLSLAGEGAAFGYGGCRGFFQQHWQPGGHAQQRVGHLKLLGVASTTSSGRSFSSISSGDWYSGTLALSATAWAEGEGSTTAQRSHLGLCKSTSI